MSNKKQAEKRFKEEIKERDAFVADGLESYPVRLYKIIMHVLKNKKEEKCEFYRCGIYGKIESDKNYFKQSINETFKQIKLFRPNYNLKDIEFEVIKEA